LFLKIIWVVWRCQLKECRENYGILEGKIVLRDKAVKITPVKEEMKMAYTNN